VSYLLDTDTLVALLRGNTAVTRRVAEEEGRLATSTISLAELYYGAYRSSRSRQNVGAIDEVRKRLPALAFAEDAAVVFGLQKALLAERGELIEDADLMVAAVAVVAGRVLVTGNAKHYRRVQGLQLQDWIQRS
jgi:tRNA(fMet)-specific endonuclease VapC